MLLAAALVVAVGLGARREATPGAGLEFRVAFDPRCRREPADGRVFVLVAQRGSPEPRLAIRGETRTSPFFAANVDGLGPGDDAVIGATADGYPIEHLRDLPAGDYWVQGLLNVYTTFRRGDGHVVKFHLDQGEGQRFEISPGNLFSRPRRVHLDPAAGGSVRILLDRVIPPIPPPRDTPRVKRFSIESRLLSRFWGRPMRLGATVLLPRDYERDAPAAYPVHYEQGHFSTEAPGGFVEAAEGGEPAGRGDAAFTRAWLAPDFPRMLYVTFQHPSPYYDASYAVDSPNTGPYGRALVEELIPAIEARFRVIAEPWARVLSGSSTGGWEALALQVFHPELFGGVSAYCPDPLDFGAFQAVDIYRETNAWRRREGSREVEIPGERDATGTVISTMRQQLVHERVLGDRGRSSEQWDAWQAAFGPLGPDGYVQPLFDPRTGAIDPGVAAYYREHSDLAHIVRARWGELGPKLAGKIRVWVGTTDSYFLDRAVRRFEAALRPLEPSWGGEVVYGPGRPHCWEGPEPLADRLREMARRMAAAAPAGANLGWAGPGRP